MKKSSLEQLFTLILHGKYSFSEFLECDLESELTEMTVRSRTLYSPSNKLKSFHYFINMVIGEQLNINGKVVFSYRKGKNALAAVQVHRKSKYFFQTDIRAFFSSINKQLIKEALLRSRDNIPVLDLDIYLDRIVDMVSVGNSLATGFSTSPLISNSVLVEFDDALVNYCTTNNLIYTRYSDDLIISSQNTIDHSIENVIESFLSQYYSDTFSLNDRKSRYSHIGQRVKILGMVILPNGDITIDRKQKKEIEVLLHFYREDKNKFRELLNDDMDKGFARISGILNYIKVVDEGYLHKLMRKYGVTVIDTLMRKASL
ncbi:reverse transcriptase domain-containing protein [Vibrio jasicida]|jgi:RNA-directed DNA polymerase|uniref:reverse transcriptase domain-containing protein n=1 Tax=Vibrio jasicida TaxID=766224 RepID=UPI0003A8C933|nr:reverse transcriptase domain-containing protein [Vibrio jasicida]